MFSRVPFQNIPCAEVVAAVGCRKRGRSHQRPSGKLANTATHTAGSKKTAWRGLARVCMVHHCPLHTAPTHNIWTPDAYATPVVILQNA
ncbi:hypothetical protein BaRGS_00017590 [Batillaria attramentaria]|uniref:Uncharacterized protein n=1 Tax=Batillaria attramentaria TaxID=370345 RepID=A0ABD0KV51_9CAEN